MLKLVGLKKDYLLKGQEPVHALKGIDINFRRNEFVSILGPSGCGKTTLLNIIGGLDRYTTGDLIIEGKSTKSYKDRDWDTYRNHSIGFIFQSYNLITHQTVLKNVELALTISGISKKERKERAIAVLDTVGLKDMYNKKPNQMSGGQMQRVAIARALINNPEILLADEPTGALDSETSIQIMDLLKEVAKDRLVIMVTHNPELAEKYSSRIVTMKDGLLTGDTKPYKGETKEELEKIQEQRKEIIAQKGKDKSSMSFFTATGLSFSNLLSKLKRTILVTIAGSIGIIGVSSVLAVSQGVTNYVDGMQDDMLSSYPVSITETTMDLTSLMSGLSNWDKGEIAKTDLTNKIAIDSMIEYLMEKYTDITKVKTNEINDDLLAFIDSIPEEYLSSIDLEYDIDPSNNIFSEWQRNPTSSKEFMSLNGLTQMYVAELSTVQDFGQYAQFVTLFTDFMKQLPAGEDYILSQYDLLGNSKFATEEDEMMIVVDSNQMLTDILLAQLGYFDEKEFIDLSKDAIQKSKKVENPVEYDYPTDFTFDEILGKKFMYYPSNEIYKITTEYQNQIKFSFQFPTSASETMNVTFNLNYDTSLDYLYGSITISGSKIDNIYFDRLGPAYENGKPYGNWLGKVTVSDVEFPFQFELKEDGTFKVLAGVDTSGETPTPIYLPGNYNYEENKPITGYRYPTSASNTWTEGKEMKIVGILKAKKTTNFGCLSSGIYYTPAFTKQYIKDACASQIVKDLKDYIRSAEGSEKTFFARTTFEYSSYRRSTTDPDIVRGEASCLNGSISIASLMGGSSSSNALSANKAFLRSMSGCATKAVKNDLGIDDYSFVEMPLTINIYPKDFAKKDLILKYLDKWNSNETLNINGKELLPMGEEGGRDELTYTDTIGMIIAVIDTLINAITIALVAFTSLSLVVSCFMIAVITYISTMERVKEIGIIRSLGGRKKDISRLFIAETLIIGLASGIFGILATEGICAILNVIVAPFGVSQIAILYPLTIIIMICLSVVLNVASGLIPSMYASKQDPVIALRTE